VTRGARHCPRCGAPLAPPRGNVQRCEACGEPTWLNPKPCAGGFLVRDGRVLLARRAREPFLGLWDVPGGFLEPGESLEDGVRRELHEETGLDVVVGSYLVSLPDVYGPDGEATLNCYFECSAGEGEPQPADDVSELRWFARDELPGRDRIAFENGPAAIEAWLTSTST
jgi:ADP-ribose pyrophosphatase YjhB (NUDIX family)